MNGNVFFILIVCAGAAELLFVLHCWNVSYNDVNAPVNHNGIVGHNK